MSCSQFWHSEGPTRQMLCTSAATAATVWVGHTQAAAWSCGEALLTVLWFGVPSLAALAVVLSALWLQDRLLYIPVL